MDATPWDAVPVVDLRDVASDAPVRRDRAAAAALHGFGRLGLVAVAGHDVSPAALDACHDAFLAVAARPEDHKRRWHRPDLWCQRGWTPPSTEHALAAGGVPDLKECWFAAPLPPDPAARARWPELYADDVWPDDDGALEAALGAAGRGLHGVGRALLGAVERGLGLDDGTFDALIDGAAHVTRALRYLPTDAASLDAGVPWGEEHTDFNLLTVLGGGRFLDPGGRAASCPDPAAGLWLRTRPDAAHPRGRLVRGAPPAGHLVAQVGQQLERLTAGALQATPHLIRPPALPGWSRVSLAHFLHVHADRVLRPLLPGTHDAAPPVRAGEHAMATLVALRLAPEHALEALRQP